LPIVSFDSTTSMHHSVDYIFKWVNLEKDISLEAYLLGSRHDSSYNEDGLTELESEESETESDEIDQSQATNEYVSSI